MTKAITLESVIEQFRDALVDGWMFGDYHYGIADVKVMLKLGFTPIPEIDTNLSLRLLVSVSILSKYRYPLMTNNGTRLNIRTRVMSFLE